MVQETDATSMKRKSYWDETVKECDVRQASHPRSRPYVDSFVWTFDMGFGKRV